MQNEPDWLTADNLIDLNEKVVASSGEPFLVRDSGLLEGAAARPNALWHYEGEEGVAALAVRLMVAVAQNHPFEQGNKRTGFIGATIFLEQNGWFLDIPDYDYVAELIED
ncbi:type II toxin-antitoxin system death-on-curing family toxin [Parasphingopyxis algicola]|uniref:type II toxin-antitoxin system death-on-curing family toxin n=1 Tax=Parasphingopyxis algicola TaxID=2026624 RepID=UPI0015A29A54|nr:Fic family protein [Parasphingopyxis algicola]QLC26676.1 type II toxin-antitoxin system death-on-curing family toxin [Parasphingopyxis algicola]